MTIGIKHGAIQWQLTLFVLYTQFCSGQRNNQGVCIYNYWYTKMCVFAFCYIMCNNFIRILVCVFVDWESDIRSTVDTWTHTGSHGVHSTDPTIVLVHWRPHLCLWKW